MQHPDFPIEFKPTLAVFNYEQTYDLLYINNVGFGGIYNHDLSTYPYWNLHIFNIIHDILSCSECSPLLISRYKLRNFPVASDYGEKLYTTFKSYAGLWHINNGDLSGVYQGAISHRIPLTSIANYYIDWEIKEENELRSYYQIQIPFPADFKDSPKNSVEISYLVNANNDSYLDNINLTKSSVPDVIKPTHYDWINHKITPKSLDANDNYNFLVKGEFCVCSLKVNPVTIDDTTYDTQSVVQSFENVSKGFLYEFAGENRLEGLLGIYANYIDNNFYFQYKKKETDKFLITINTQYQWVSAYYRQYIMYNDWLLPDAFELSRYGEIADIGTTQTWVGLPEYLKKSCFISANNDYWNSGEVSDLLDDGNFFFTLSEETTENDTKFIKAWQYQKNINATGNNLYIQYASFGEDYHHEFIQDMFEVTTIEVDAHISEILYEWSDDWHETTHEYFEELENTLLVSRQAVQNVPLKLINQERVVPVDFDFQDKANQSNVFTRIAYYDDELVSTNEPLPNTAILSYLINPMVRGDNDISHLEVRNSEFSEKDIILQHGDKDKFCQNQHWIQYGLKYDKSLDGSILNLEGFVCHGYITSKEINNTPYFPYSLEIESSEYKSYPSPPWIEYDWLGQTGYYEIRLDLPFTFDHFWMSESDIPHEICHDLTYLTELELANQLKLIQEDIMSNILLEEIHVCLGAGEFSLDPESHNPIFMNLSRRIRDICTALGLLFEENGEIRSLRQSSLIEQGDDIPPGWAIGQFNRHLGNQTNPNAQQGGFESEERLGIVYEIKSNSFTTHPCTGGKQLGRSGYILCECLPQYDHVRMQDLDKSLGLQESGAYVIENPNYLKSDKYPDLPAYFEFEGLSDLIKNMAYTLAEISRQSSQANLGILKTQAINTEILLSLGLPCVEKNLMINVDGQSITLPYPAFNSESMSLADLHFLQLQNLSILNQSNISINLKQS